MTSWLETHEFVAIWLEGIALLAIFIWDRIDSHREHQATRANIEVSQRQFESSVRPVLIPRVVQDWVGDRVHAGSFSITNNGPNEAVITGVALDFYCSASEHCEHQPIDYPLLRAQLLTPGQILSENYRLDPWKEIYYHEPHDGECKWIFTLEVKCSDVLRLRTHTYRFDEVLGIHHFIDPIFPRTSLFLRLVNKFRMFRNRLTAFVQTRWARLKKQKTTA
jgi:hypothetical protein